MTSCIFFCFFFFNDTATTEIYTLSLHDALPIFARSLTRPCFPNCSLHGSLRENKPVSDACANCFPDACCRGDRKSTRLNSSHANISYAVFCLKKKKKKISTSLINIPLLPVIVHI